MAEFIKVATVSDIPSGEGAVIEINGRALALFNVNGEFYALDNICGHRGGPLGDGYCNPQNLTVQCPWHGWVYALTTGVCTLNPNSRVEKFAVRVEGEEVQVSLG